MFLKERVFIASEEPLQRLPLVLGIPLPSKGSSAMRIYKWLQGMYRMFQNKPIE